MAGVNCFELPRLCRVLAGERSWALARLATLDPASTLWVGREVPPSFRAVPPKQVTRHLGSECAVLVFDTHDGLDADALAAALGTLRGGGSLLLLTPDWQHWVELDTSALRFAAHPLGAEAIGRRFPARLRGALQSHAQVTLETPHTHPAPLQLQQECAPAPGLQLSEEQQAVVHAVDRVALGHARRPLVLLADRGRGKSTALGAALAALLREHPKQVLLLAPSAAAVQALFAELQRELPQGELHADTFAWQGGSVQLRLPQQQANEPAPCDLLVIDEAATLSVALLAGLLQTHNRVVFSSTVHGYEGSGRGFVLRFTRLLDRSCRQWKRLSLSRPLRWADDDPLEALFNQALLLDAEPLPAPDPVEEQLLWVDQQQLADDENLLRQVFALLVAAHYQTRPSDLQQLLDAPGLQLLLAMRDQVLVGCTLLVQEGGLDAQLAQAVCDGERRPRGHMLVQSLALHAGLCELPQLRLLRVMRIAVHQDCRRQGIGSRMLAQVQERARRQGFDLLGSAFAVDVELLSLWRRAGFAPARLGQRVDASSGSHSLQVLLGLNARGRQLAEAAQMRFQQQLPWRLASVFKALDADLAIALLHGRDCSDLPLTDQDRQDIQAFAHARRGFEDVQPALWRWLCRVFARHGVADLQPRECALLLKRVLQHQAPPDVARSTGFAAGAAQLEALRTALKNLLAQG